MAGRALVYGDPEVQALLTRRFVPVADNVSYLQRRQDAVGVLFRTLCEQGHYGGRVRPTDTRQGQYAGLPDGTLLASINTREPGHLLAMLRGALARLEAEGRPVAMPPHLADLDAGFPRDPRFTWAYPEEGLVLKVYARDLPRGEGQAGGDWKHGAVNSDHAWFTRDELDALLPLPPVRAGQHLEVPDFFSWRLARFHIIDNVRGQTPMWRPEHVREARLTLRVVDTAEGGRCRFEVTGRIHCQARGSWPIASFQEPAPDQERGLAVEVYGELEADLEGREVDRLELVAAGTRWGGSQYNLRADDLEPAPIGYSFSVAGREPMDRVPPAGIPWAEYFAAAAG